MGKDFLEAAEAKHGGYIAFETHYQDSYRRFS